MTLILYLTIAAIIWGVFYKSRMRHDVELNISGGSGSFFRTTISNNLRREEGFNMMPLRGASVRLGKIYPHLYLDSHGDSRFVGPHITFNNDQRIKLEGDFNNQFQLFSPKGYQELSLSIFTPDVMYTLLAHNHRFDIEIIGNSLYLYTDKNIKKDSIVYKDIIKVLEAILKEIDHKSHTWTENNEQRSKAAILSYRNQQSYKLLGYYISLKQLFLGIFAIFAVFLAYFGSRQASGVDTLMYFLLAGLCFPGAWIVMFLVEEKTKSLL